MKRSYRIETTKYGHYAVKTKVGWWPFWYSPCLYERKFETLEAARSHIDYLVSLDSKPESRVVEYYPPQEIQESTSFKGGVCTVEFNSVHRPYLESQKGRGEQ